MKPRDWEILKSYGVTPDNLSVGWSLNLRGTGITALPDNLSVGGWLDLTGPPYQSFTRIIGDTNCAA